MVTFIIPWQGDHDRRYNRSQLVPNEFKGISKSYQAKFVCSLLTTSLLYLGREIMTDAITVPSWFPMNLKAY